MKRTFTVKQILITLVVVFLGYHVLTAKIENWQRQKFIEKVMTGTIRANNTSKIYHVPTCPQYENNSPNVINFNTMADAETAGYTASRNCSEAMDIRRVNEEETPDLPERDSDAQYR